jgi:hypothetical protein
MKTAMRRAAICASVLVALASVASSQESKKPGVLAPADLKPVMPASYFFRGQSASVQMRNAVGVRTKDDRYILAALVDTSGYASDIAQRYQGLLITEVKLKIEDSSLAPGAYGFGFLADGGFLVEDVGANEVLRVPSKRDDKVQRAVPLKMVEEGGAYRLYAGKKYVDIHVD